MTNSTARAFSNAQNSLKSGARSNPLPPQELDGGQPLGRGPALPIGQLAIRPRIVGESRHRECSSIEPKFHNRHSTRLDTQQGPKASREGGCGFDRRAKLVDADRRVTWQIAGEPIEELRQLLAIDESGLDHACDVI